MIFKSPDSHLSVSNSAIMSSESFSVPMTLRSEARTSMAAFEALHKAFGEIKGFIPQLAVVAPGIVLIAFEENVSPRLSRMKVQLRGKDFRYDLTFALKCPVPKEQDFWARIRLISAVYDRLTELAAGFQDRKGVELFLEESRLDQQKEDPDRPMPFHK